MLKLDAQKRLTLRLRRIEGQVRGLERMVDEPRLCVELLTQIAAVQSALKSVGDEIFHYHVRRCVPESFSRRLRHNERERLEEMERIFVQYCKEPVQLRSAALEDYLRRSDLGAEPNSGKPRRRESLTASESER